MSHRLFQTLVISSAALIEACATPRAQAPSPPTPTATSPVGAEPASETATVAAPMSPAPSPGSEGSEIPTDEAAIAAMLRDARVCGEVGWPTTKSASAHMRSVVRGEQQYFCLLPQGMARYPGRPRCCELTHRR